MRRLPAYLGVDSRWRYRGGLSAVFWDCQHTQAVEGVPAGGVDLGAEALNAREASASRRCVAAERPSARAAIGAAEEEGLQSRQPTHSKLGWAYWKHHTLTRHCVLNHCLLKISGSKSSGMQSTEPNRGEIRTGGGHEASGRNRSGFTRLSRALGPYGPRSKQGAVLWQGTWKQELFRVSGLRVCDFAKLHENPLSSSDHLSMLALRPNSRDSHRASCSISQLQEVRKKL